MLQLVICIFEQRQPAADTSGPPTVVWVPVNITLKIPLPDLVVFLWAAQGDISTEVVARQQLYKLIQLYCG